MTSSELTPEELEAQLARLHEDSFGWALSCCGWDEMEAEDVLQTTYLKVVSGRARFGGRSAFRTWLFGVIRQTAYEHIRRAKSVKVPLRSVIRLKFTTARPSTWWNWISERAVICS